MHEIELYMISVFYDYSIKPEGGLLPVKFVDIGEKLDNKNSSEWTIRNHYRSHKDGRLRQIGIRFINKKNNVDTAYITSPDNECKNEFVYNKDKDIWLEPTFFSPIKKNNYYIFDQTKLLTGITNAGTANLCCTSEGNSKHVGTVYFIPSALSMIDYEDMVSDLYRIHEDLVRDNRNIAKVGIDSSKILRNLQDQLKKLRYSVKQISSNPNTELKLHTEKRNDHSSGRFDIRMEIDRYTNPGKPNYRSRKLVSMNTTFENQLIKQMLEDLVCYAKTLGSDEIKTKALLRKLTNEQVLYFDKSNKNVRNSLGNIENLDKNYKSLHNELKENMRKFSEEENIIRQSIKAKLDFTNNINQENNIEYIELNISINGKFAPNNRYNHYQFERGIVAELSYDQWRNSEFKIINYVINGNRTVHNSHFGEIQLTSNNIISHALLFKALCEKSQLESEANMKKIRITGYVRCQPNGIDAVATEGNKGYQKYLFDFAHISSVNIDGNEVEIQTKKNELLAFLDNEIPVKMIHIEQSEEANMRLKQLEKLDELSKYKLEVIDIAKRYDGLRESAENLLELPLFSMLDTTKRIPIIPTQIFLHNPIYRVAWKSIQGLKRELSVSLYVEQNDKQINTGKVEHIYELWIFYKIIDILTKKIGWKLKDSKNIIESLREYLIGNKKKQTSSCVNLSWENWKIELYHEPKIDLLQGNYIKPDFIFKFKKDNEYKGMAVLDAKYRDYSSQGSTQWVEDVVTVAMNKYGNMQPKDLFWKVPIVTSSIVHSDTKISENAEEKYNPYHVLYNEKLFDEKLSSETAHKYGSIYMIPSKTYVFENWFRSIMEYQLGEYKVCWNCGKSKEIEEKNLLTQSGYPKYHYICNSCNEFWVKVHCSKKGHHDLIKHMNNYHLQVERGEKWYVVCPSCGDGMKEGE